MTGRTMHGVETHSIVDDATATTNWVWYHVAATSNPQLNVDVTR